MSINRSVLGVLAAVAVMTAAAQGHTDGSAECVQSGPTLELGYAADALGNSVDTFMYFVPLTSLTAVHTVIDPNTQFAAGIVNRQCRYTRNNRFTVTCDFEIIGNGVYRVVYDPDEMIELVSNGDRTKRRLTNLLDWIQFDGDCLGRVEAVGTVRNGQAVVDEVTVSFNRGRMRSPVTILLYDLPRVNRDYDYSHRQNATLARVNSLTFRRSNQSPRMSVEVASVQKADQTEGIVGSIAALFANLLLSPLPVSEVGNDTMLDFGLALYQQDSEFTFPVAQTLRPSAESVQVASF